MQPEYFNNVALGDKLRWGGGGGINKQEFPQLRGLLGLLIGPFLRQR